jgi:hypothetical protein
MSLMGFRRMRYIIIFSIIFVLSGVILVSGSLFMVPCMVREPFRVDRSKTWEDDTFTLQPNSNRTYILDSIAQNWSIFQVDVDSSDFIVFKIISYTTGEIWFEIESRWDVTSYWTPPLLGHGIWRFVFHNPSSTPVNVTAKITEFYLKITEYRDVTYYRSFVDPVYGYVGILLIIAGTALNVAHASREARKLRTS